MNAGLIAGLRAQLGGSRDGALLRYSLGNALLAQGDFAAAIEALQQALAFDPRYSAAADASFEQGIAVAQARGDVQAAKEMAVFRKRLHKPAS